MPRKYKKRKVSLEPRDDCNEDGSRIGFEHVTLVQLRGRQDWMAIWRGRPARGKFHTKSDAEAWIKKCDDAKKWVE